MKLASRKTPRLRKIGFQIVFDEKNRVTIWHFVDSLIRHPIFITVLTFLFTGVVAQAITREYAEKQKQSELFASQARGVKDSIDDLAVTYNIYHLHAMRLVEARRDGEKIDASSANYREYQAAYFAWREKFARDMAIAKRQINANKDSVYHAELYVELDSGIFDSCIRKSNLWMKRTEDGGDKRLVCKFSEVNAVDVIGELRRITICMYTIGKALDAVPDIESSAYPDTPSQAALTTRCSLSALSQRLGY